MYRNWFLDFDDTLVVGPTTWGLTQALPRFVRRHNLPTDVGRLHAQALMAQQQLASGSQPAAILSQFFDAVA